MTLKRESRLNSTAGGWTERQGAMWEEMRGADCAMLLRVFAGRLRRNGPIFMFPAGCKTALATLVLCGGAAVLCGAAATAQAQDDWSPELAPAASEIRGRSEAIVILLPSDLDPASYQRLAVE